MLQLSYRGNGALAVDDVDPPGLGPGEVRVRVHSTGLCKSDVYGYSGLNDRRDVVIGPGELLVMGHEVAGYVDGTPVAVNPIYGCGECPVCRGGNENLCGARVVLGCTPDAPGGYAESIVVPRRNVHELDADLPIEIGALVEPLTVGAHGVRLAGLSAGDRVLVIGGGIIGLGAALAAQRRVGAEGVLVLEPLADRRELCSRLGLLAAAPEDVLGSGQTFDVALDCVARPETFAGAIAAVPPRGVVVLVGIWSDTIPIPVSEVVGRETRIMGSYGYSNDDFADVAAWVGRREVDLAPIIELRVGFETVIAAFASYADGSLNAVRTLFQPDRGAAP